MQWRTTAIGPTQSRAANKARCVGYPVLPWRRGLWWLRWPVPAEEGHDKELFLRSVEEAVKTRGQNGEDHRPLLYRRRSGQ